MTATAILMCSSRDTCRSTLTICPFLAARKRVRSRASVSNAARAGFRARADLFFRNNGDGTFEETSQKTGVADEKKYYGLGAVWCDYDNDGWPDLYVADDGTPNYLYKNNRNGTLTDVGFETGTSFSGAGVEQGSMGIAFGDYDNDGLGDLFVTNFDNEHNTLYKNVGDKGLLDVSMEAKVGAVSIPYVGWGAWFRRS